MSRNTEKVCASFQAFIHIYVAINFEGSPCLSRSDKQENRHICIINSFLNLWNVHDLTWRKRNLVITYFSKKCFSYFWWLGILKRNRGLKTNTEKSIYLNKKGKLFWPCHEWLSLQEGTKMGQKVAKYPNQKCQNWRFFARWAGTNTHA